jgi:hypothetical protein
MVSTVLFDPEEKLPILIPFNDLPSVVVRLAIFKASKLPMAPLIFEEVLATVLVYSRLAPYSLSRVGKS